MTTTPDFRALCAELVTAFKDESTYTQRIEILDRACTALATSPPEPPTDEELQEWVNATLGAEVGDPQEFGWGWHCFTKKQFACAIRAALKRWGK